MVLGLLGTIAAAAALAAPSGGVPAVGRTVELDSRSGAPVAAPAKPPVFSRLAWDPGPQTPPALDPEPRARIMVHHTAQPVTPEQYGLPTGSKQSEAAAAEVLRSILALHRGEGWADIGYHYVIDWEGRVWSARPIDSLGAHTEGHNEGSIGVAMMGNWDLPARDTKEAAARRRQLAGLEAWLTWLAWSYRIPAERILGHHEYNATACPGRYLSRTVAGDLEAERRGLAPSPLRAIRLRIRARLQPRVAPTALFARARVPAPSWARVSRRVELPGGLEAIFDGGSDVPSRVLAPLNPNVARAASWR